MLYRPTRDDLTKFLDRGQTTIGVAKSGEGVVLPVDVPEQHGVVILNLSWLFGGAMELTDEAVVATLSFNGTDFECVLPYKALVFARQHDSVAPPQTEKPRPKLRVVK